MDDKIKAIKAAVSFIRDNWIGKNKMFWQGCGNDFVTLLGSLGNDNVSIKDLELLLEAQFDGEPIPVDIDGWFNKDNTLAQIIIKKEV
tara:strand:+ start:69 stop:332 length:264 start_codon:yes stop_codon:yes gene_type:complete